MQAAGFYHNLDTRPSLPYRNYNTWMGDPTRTLQAREIIRAVKKHDLVAKTAEVGAYIYKGLESLGLENLRGEDAGTFIAFDCATGEQRDKLVMAMRKEGVHLGGCGERSIRLRPMLVFEKGHADIFLDRLGTVLRQL